MADRQLELLLLERYLRDFFAAAIKTPMIHQNILRLQKLDQQGHSITNPNNALCLTPQIGNLMIPDQHMEPISCDKHISACTVSVSINNGSFDITFGLELKN